jgi:hypothetical protein
VTAKIPKYTREWLIEAMKLSIASLKRGDDEKTVVLRLCEALNGFLESNKVQKN